MSITSEREMRYPEERIQVPEQTPQQTDTEAALRFVFDSCRLRLCLRGKRREPVECSTVYAKRNMFKTLEENDIVCCIKDS